MANVKTPGKREALTRERVLRAALEIVDREGLEAISMRRIGEALGVEAMSIYHHVASKAAILDGLFEIVLGGLPAPRRSGAWQVALRDHARALRAVLRAHPNTLSIFATRPAVTPASIAHVEAVLAVLHDAGFTTEHALRALHVLVAFAVGHAIATYAPVRAEDASYPAYGQLSAAEFPRVREAAGVLPDYDVEREFELGLEAMLTGLEVQRTRAVPRSARKAVKRRG